MNSNAYEAVIVIIGIWGCVGWMLAMTQTRTLTKMKLEKLRDENAHDFSDATD